MQACPVCRAANSERVYCIACGHQLRPEPRPDPYLGQIVGGRFQLLARLDDRRAPQVFEAKEIATRERVVVWFVHPVLAARPGFAARFADVSKRQLLLRDAHLVRTHAAGTTEHGELYVVSELVRQPRLAEVLRAEGRLALERALELLAQLCSAVDAAHALEAVGALTPEEIYLERRPAELVRVDASPFLRPATIDPYRELRGQPLDHGAYMSPEQLLAQPLDARSEVYNLGVLAYEMLTGRLPLTEDRNPAVRVMAQRGSRAAPPSTIAGVTVPADCDDLILRCLEPVPADRHADVSALRDAVLAVQRVS